MRRGRPLRFLAVVIGGWVATRVALLLPEAVPSTAFPIAIAAAPGGPAPPTQLREPAGRAAVAPRPAMRFAAGSDSAVRPAAALPLARPRNPALALAALIRFGPAVPVGAPAQQAEPTLPPPLAPAPIARGGSRLAGSAWLIARGGAGRDPLAGQLGGSQAGARLTYALDRGRRIAASARVAAPLGGGGGAEAGLGLDWQPTRAPLHLLAEQRIPLEGGRGGPALLAIGGFGPTALAPRLRAEAYAQAGVVFRDRAEGFGDGAIRLTTPVGPAGGVRLDLGAGAWGGIQRGARRLDLGPTLGAAVPVAGRAVRLTLDWRERVAGDARPGSGPAMSVGMDF